MLFTFVERFPKSKSNKIRLQEGTPQEPKNLIDKRMVNKVFQLLGVSASFLSLLFFHFKSYPLFEINLKLNECAKNHSEISPEVTNPKTSQFLELQTNSPASFGIPPSHFVWNIWRTEPKQWNPAPRYGYS